MRCRYLVVGCAVLVAGVVRSSPAQTARPLPDAAALFDTAVAHIVELELAVIQARARGRSAPHPDVAVPIQQLSALRELLAGLSDTGEVNAAVRSQLVPALNARLASNVVAQRLLAVRQDSTPPDRHTLPKEEELLRARLRELGVPEPRDR
jgi:hypothetical protein